MHLETSINYALLITKLSVDDAFQARLLYMVLHIIKKQRYCIA